jgi:hypothetical protein
MLLWYEPPEFTPPGVEVCVIVGAVHQAFVIPLFVRFSRTLTCSAAESSRDVLTTFPIGKKLVGVSGPAFTKSPPRPVPLYAGPPG